jgi:hypothetical protein
LWYNILINKGKDMKKLIRIIGFGAFAILIASTAYADMDTNSLCTLVNELKGVFNILRTLAFVGAAFVIASIGWDAIIKKEYKWTEDGKKHLIAMIVGFTLLFSVGIILTFLTNGKLLSCVGGTW